MVYIHQISVLKEISINGLSVHFSLNVEKSDG
jgi:hypothetical protein